MRLVGFLIALPAVYLASVCSMASAAELSSYRYACVVSSSSGETVATLQILIEAQQSEHEGSPDGADVMVEVSQVSDNERIPSFPKFTVPQSLLFSGEFRVMALPVGSSPPPGPQLPRTGVGLTFPEGLGGTNGFVVIYRNRPSSHFETSSIHPTESGICVPHVQENVQ